MTDARSCVTNLSHSVLVIVPAYREEGQIGPVVQKILLALGQDAQILVIDDGSSDQTATEARHAGARVIRLMQNLGYGFALQTGYSYALENGYDIVVQLDGDGQHCPDSIRDLLQPILDNRADLTIGSRALSNVHYPMPLARRLGQRFFASILKLLTGMSFGDPTSGFQAMNTKVMQLYTTDDFAPDYPDTNVLLYLHYHDARIIEVPATFYVSTTNKSMHGGIVKPLYYIYNMLFSMLIIYLRYSRARKDRQ